MGLHARIPTRPKKITRFPSIARFPTICCIFRLCWVHAKSSKTILKDNDDDDDGENDDSDSDDDEDDDDDGDVINDDHVYFNKRTRRRTLSKRRRNILYMVRGVRSCRVRALRAQNTSKTVKVGKYALREGTCAIHQSMYSMLKVIEINNDFITGSSART